VASTGDTLYIRHERACATEGVLTAEIWQFLMVISGFFIVALLWLFVVYLPGRTLERWEGQRPGRGDGGGRFSGR
jgi:hypothetical protein